MKRAITFVICIAGSALGGCHALIGHRPVPASEGGAPPDRTLPVDRLDAAAPDLAPRFDQPMWPDLAKKADSLKPDLRPDLPKPDLPKPDLPYGIVPAPRPISPLSTTTSLRAKPTFGWKPPATAIGTRIEVALDRAFTKPVASQNYGGGTGTGTLSQALPPGKTYFWRLRGYSTTTIGASVSAVWQLYVAPVPVGSSGQQPSTAWGNLADVDGNGLADLVIGSLAGSLWVYRSVGVATPELHKTITHAANEFGRNPSATDLNGDGLADLVIGSSANTTRVYLNVGAGQLPTAMATTWAGGMPAGIGDVNGDGYGDMLVADRDALAGKGSVQLVLGSSTGPLAAAAASYVGSFSTSNLGQSVDGAGDVNGDGYADFILGTYSENAAYVCLGNSILPTSLSQCQKLTGPDGGQFGWQVAGAGDMNGDGYADVAVSAVNYSNHLGRAYVYLGSPSGIVTSPKWTLQGVTPEAAFGHSLSGAGDVNGDGYADLVVGACAYLLYPTAPGDRAFLFWGAASTAGPLSKQELASPFSTSKNLKFGESVAGVGDVDGDGRGELAVSSSVEERKVYVYGWDTGVGKAILRWTLSQPTINNFGINLARTH